MPTLKGIVMQVTVWEKVFGKRKRVCRGGDVTDAEIIRNARLIRFQWHDLRKDAARIKRRNHRLSFCSGISRAPRYRSFPKYRTISAPVLYLEKKKASELDLQDLLLMCSYRLQDRPTDVPGGDYRGQRPERIREIIL